MDSWFNILKSVNLILQINKEQTYDINAFRKKHLIKPNILS